MTRSEPAGYLELNIVHRSAASAPAKQRPRQVQRVRHLAGINRANRYQLRRICGPNSKLANPLAALYPVRSKMPPARCYAFSGPELE